MKMFVDDQPFRLEDGNSVYGLTIAYHTYGTLRPEKDNVVWICHALTGDSDAQRWWSGLVGPGQVIDTDRMFVVCANMIGSCYGSTEFRDVTGQIVTTRDQVRAFMRLRQHLQLPQIRLLIGGSMGGQHVLEWAVYEPAVVERIVPIATNARHLPWVVALNAAQRMAIEADGTFGTSSPLAGAAGLAAARAMAMITYRTPLQYSLDQQPADERLSAFPSEMYQRYQGRKLVERFHAHAYYVLTRSMDSHDLGRGRGGAGAVLRSITAQTLSIGIDSDILFPESEQQFIADMVPRAQYGRLTSSAGHDAFLIHTDRLAKILHKSGIIP